MKLLFLIWNKSIADIKRLISFIDFFKTGEKMISEEKYFKAFTERILQGNILNEQHIVVPIKTEGRSYGRISMGFQNKYPQIKIPTLELRHAKTIDIGKGKTVTFICYWSEDSSYSDTHIKFCVTKSMRTFVEYMRKNGKFYIDDLFLFLPIFKGLEKNKEIAIKTEKEMRFVEASNDPLWRSIGFLFMINQYI